MPYLSLDLPLTKYHFSVHVVSFSETSSPELDNLLASIRHKIILPSYLQLEQRKKLYDHRYEKKLQADPITMEIDGETLKFYYTDLLNDMPNTRNIVFKAVDQMKTPDDWQNLPRLLEGVCVHAGRKLRHYDYPKMIRKAGFQGQLRVIFACIREAKRTGFKLATSETVNELLVWVQKEAIESDWDKVATEQALAWTERVIESLEDEKHQPVRKRGKKDLKAFPLFRDPQVLAPRLHMAAALAAKHNGGEDAGGKVTKYAKELMSLWPEGKGLMELHSPQAYQEREELRYLLNNNEFLWCAAPILSGLRMAAEVVEPALAEQLKRRIGPLEKEVETAWQAVSKDSTGKGREIYKALFEA